MMAFTKFLYNLINWKNKSDSLTTPLGASNLNKMDSAIKTIGDNLNTAYDELSERKLDKDTANTMISNVSYAESTGVFTITRLNGSSITIDTKLEKLVTNWIYDKDSQKLILTLDDGSTQEVDMSALITQYEFVESDTIAFTIESNGTVTANVKDGSITEAKLQPNYLAEVKTNASNAETSAQNASEYADNASYDAKLAQSYAIGRSGGIREGEDADNAKYYMEQAKAYSQGSASNISYDNTTSGAEATDVQDALDEIQEEYLRQDALMENLADNANEAQYNLFNDIGDVTTDVSDASFFVCSRVAPNKTEGALYKRKATTVWAWIKSKIESVLGIKGVANNLVTNQEGYALDARQGKILNDLIAKISTNAKAKAFNFQNIPNGIEMTASYNMFNNLFCINGKGTFTPTATGWMSLMSDNRFDTIDSTEKYFSLTLRRTDTGALVNSYGRIYRNETTGYLSLQASIPTANIQYQVIFNITIYLATV